MPIHISVKGGQIKCDPQNGHLVANGGDKVVWVGDGGVQFTLLFTEYGKTSGWPFTDPPETPPPTWPQGDFTGKLTNDPAAPSCFKYTVQVKGCADLDPIIIVNK